MSEPDSEASFPTPRRTQDVVAESAPVAARHRCLISARSDTEAIAVWLAARGSRSPETRARYQAEAERFLSFIDSRGLTLAAAGVEEVLAYAQACRTGRFNSRARGRGNQESSVRASVAALSSLYRFLHEANYVSGNPVALIPKPRAQKTTHDIERRIGDDQLGAISSEIRDRWSRAGEPLEIQKIARLNFALSWMLTTMCRISELLNSRMDAVHLANEGNAKAWYWTVRRKGGQVSHLPLSNAAVDALAAYRAHRDLPPYPVGLEEGYLLQPLQSGKDRPLNRSTLSRDFRDLFDEAAERLPEGADRRHLAQATSHWLRHTGASRLLDEGADIRLVSRLLDHSSIATTSRIYDHPDRVRMRSAMNDTGLPEFAKNASYESE